MARKTTTKSKNTRKASKVTARPGMLRLALRGIVSFAIAVVASVAVLAVIPPPTTPYVLAEGVRLGGIKRTWVSIDEVAPVMVRSVVAAEDADFCLHWGFDMNALRAVIAEGGNRGASTISQQVVKNVWLWQGRSWPRKALEGVMTPVVEALWSKRRILEVYLNVAEFDTGVFGIEAAAQHHFKVSARDLNARQAALLAAVLPNPKERQAVPPTAFIERRARAIADGAATIAADGRSRCFET